MLFSAGITVGLCYETYPGTNPECYQSCTGAGWTHRKCREMVGIGVCFKGCDSSCLKPCHSEAYPIYKCMHKCCNSSKFFYKQVFSGGKWSFFTENTKTVSNSKVFLRTGKWGGTNRWSRRAGTSLLSRRKAEAWLEYLGWRKVANS